MKVKVNGSSIALKEERLGKEKKAEERAIMFMNPCMIDAMSRKY